MKIVFILYVALLLTGIYEATLPIFEKYVYSDWEFISFLAILIFVDTVTGFWKHWVHRTVSSSAWGRIFQKLLSYSFVLIVLHNFAHFTIDAKVFSYLNIIEKYGCAALIVKEGISIFENLGAINPNWIPKWILNKLKEFDNSGNFKNHGK